MRLGSGITRTPYTRSWGYAHYTEDEFRRIVDPPEPDPMDEDESLTR